MIVLSPVLFFVLMIDHDCAFSGALVCAHDCAFSGAMFCVQHEATAP